MSSSLMESAAVLGLETALLVSLAATMLSGLAVLNDGERASADLLRHRQVERLLAGSFERCATGPGVVVIHEIPGPTPSVIGFGEELVEAGYTVVMPHLFGRAEAPMAAGAVARIDARLM